MRTFQVVLMDVDGTLVDSNDLHAEAWKEALDHFGYKVAFEDVRPLIGMGGEKLIPILTGLASSDPKIKAIGDHRKKVFVANYQGLVKPIPGAKDLLARLKREGYRLVVSTSATEEEYRPLLELDGMARYFDAATSADDADNAKPDPDIVLAALKKMGVAPEHAVLVGDTPYDVEAASRAAVQTIAFRSGGWADKTLDGAVAIFDGPSDLLIHLEESPLGEPNLRK